MNGKVGYLNVTEISDGFAFPKSDSGASVDVAAELTKAKVRQKTLMIQPNEGGWRTGAVNVCRWSATVSTAQGD